MEKLTFQDFVDMENIEKQYFDATNIMPAKESHKLYLKDPKHICVIRSEKKVIGFAIALPLKKDSYEKVKSGLLQETKLAVDDLDFDRTAYSYIYLSAIAIDKKHRSFGNLIALMGVFKSHMRDIVQQATVKEVMADVLTDEGKKIAINFFKMKPFLNTKWNSTIYCVDGNTFKESLLNNKFGSGGRI